MAAPVCFTEPLAPALQPDIIGRDSPGSPGHGSRRMSIPNPPPDPPHPGESGYAALVNSLGGIVWEAEDVSQGGRVRCKIVSQAVLPSAT